MFTPKVSIPIASKSLYGGSVLVKVFLEKFKNLGPGKKGLDRFIPTLLLLKVVSLISRTEKKPFAFIAFSALLITELLLVVSEEP